MKKHNIYHPKGEISSKSTFGPRYGYSFKNNSFLKASLDRYHPDFRRFEFLGDAVMSFAVTNELTNIYFGNEKYILGQKRQKGTGTLSNFRSKMTSNKTLCIVFDKMGFIDYTNFGNVTNQNQYKQLKADYVEAIFGAIWQDSKDLKIVWHFMVEWIIKSGAFEEVNPDIGDETHEIE